MSVGINVDFATFTRIAPHVIKAAKPVILRGRHGVGKSELVYCIAKQLGLPVVERRASQMTEGDLVGLPSVDGNRTRFNPPDWFKEACEKPVALFLDEVDRATIEVRQGIFELTDSRKLNGHMLDPGTRIFAAVNGGKHAQQYQVGEMDPAELDRWSVFDVEPTIEDWLIWGKGDGIKNGVWEGKVHPAIWDFINKNHNHLEHNEDYEPNKKYPSRRSWKRLSDVLTQSGQLDGEFDRDIIPITNAFVGMEAAIAFGDFVKNIQKQVVPDDILKKGKFDLVKDFTINDHCALIDKMDNLGVLKPKLDPKEIKNFAQYFVMLPSEAAMKLFKVLGKNGTKENNVNFYKETAKVDVGDGKIEEMPISKFMVRLLGTPEAQKAAK